ncbi:hypothetical protein A0H81_08045 [Grifola frondosa]|uniref:Uncharacterized protein n=1 Tax=Grifola frondosa TaxID=5627 RepID=A0A1C7MAY7_GRIFR|nr:hypothetical protein A0H81_08045 [Grifola frondosa]
MKFTAFSKYNMHFSHERPRLQPRQRRGRPNAQVIPAADAENNAYCMLEKAVQIMDDPNGTLHGRSRTCGTIG